MNSITFHPRFYVPRPWTPLTRAEFDELALWLPSLREHEHEPRRGRRLDNPRRTMDAIFWMACSSKPWRELPPELGKPDTAHRLLRRWAIKGELGRLIMALSAHPVAGGTKMLRSMGYWICRAWRRMCRVVALAEVALVHNINVLNARPAPVIRLPNWRHFLVRWVRRALAEIWLATAAAARLLLGQGLWPGLVRVPDLAAKTLVAAVRRARRGLRRWMASSNGNRGAWQTR